MPDSDQRPTLASPDDDPFLWLEEVEGIRSIEWVNAQNAATLSRFAGTAVAADADLLQGIFERPDALPNIARRGGRIFNYWTDEQHPRGLWRSTTLESFRNEHTDWQIILDLDALADSEGEDWIWRGAVTLPGTHDRTVLELSRGGSDAVVLREFDLAACDFVSGGFDLPDGRNSVMWLDRDTLLLSCPLGPDMQTRSGLPRTVRLWHRGTDPATTPIIFQTRQDFVGAWASVERDKGAEHIWFIEKPGLFEAIVWLGDRTGPHTRLCAAFRCEGAAAPRMACDTAPHTLGNQRKNICDGYSRWHFARGLRVWRLPVHELRSSRAIGELCSISFGVTDAWSCRSSKISGQRLRS